VVGWDTPHVKELQHEEVPTVEDIQKPSSSSS
jgi:hypothetical protein